MGVACGRLDPIACAWGKPLFLRFSEQNVQLEPLSVHLELVVGSFPLHRNTSEILATLNQDFQQGGPSRQIIKGFALQAEAGKEALLAWDLPAVGKAMDHCQFLYESFRFPALQAPGLLQAVRVLRNHGALGAKFSGAGGEGSVIGLYTPGADSNAGVMALQNLGLDAFVMSLFFQ